ncbi:YopX family protein [Lapidilactobacillus luobeiensis]|uniref:YopX family protein n=1 Tax=Lapidilactobacillus luobeiensis TaxID=2950371 RepID=UPI0021C45D02|nr:YopX family protein [Lapidilactobacillus luobeiensis]
MNNKYRVWFKDDQVLGTPDDVVIYPNGEVWELLWEPDREITQDVIISHNIGIKDVNGIEIYEGDIIKSAFSYKPLLVRWLDADVMIDAGGYRIDLAAKHGEVIGNIFENPELLEAGK